jgi:hypothetical protein
MGKNSRELRLVVGGRKQARIHIDVAARYRESVYRPGIVNNIDVPVNMRSIAAGHSEDAIGNPRDVTRYDRIV